MNYTTRNHQRNHHNPSENPVFPSKMVEVVKSKLVRESSFLYGKRRVNCPVDAYELVDTPTAKAMGFLGDETPVCFQ